MSDKCCSEEPLKLTETQKIKILNAIARELESMGLLSPDSLYRGDHIDMAKVMVEEMDPLAAAARIKKVVMPEDLSKTVFGNIKDKSAGAFDVQDAIKVAKAVCTVADVVCPFVKEM